jgi:hypothetical protein
MCIKNTITKNKAMKKPEEIMSKLKGVTEFIYSYLFIVFFIFSIAILLVSSVFQIPGIVDHPQFDSYVDAELIRQLVSKNGETWMRNSYYGYFILDFIWPILLLLVVYKIVKHRSETDTKQFSPTLLYTAIVLMILAYGFDFAENVNYWRNFSYSKFLAYTKIGLYASVALLLLYSILNVIINDFLPTVWVFIKSAFFSLLILVIIGIFLPTASQVNSIVVDLYLLPYNLFILLVILLPFFAIVVAHYPSYFNYVNGRRDWFMANNSFFNLIGIIYYRNKKYKNTDKVNERTLNFLFRVLGICFYTALFYMVAYTSEINFGWKLQMSKLSFALFVSGVFLLHFLMNIKSEWYKHHYKYLEERMTDFYDGDYTPSDEKKKNRIEYLLLNWIKKNFIPKVKTDTDVSAKLHELKVIMREFKVINIPVIGYLILISLTILFHLGYFIALFTSAEKYTEEMAVFSLVAIFLQMVTFIFYRAFRSLLRFVLFNKCSRSNINAFLENPNLNNYDCENSGDENLDPKVKEIFSFFSDFNFSKDSRFLSFFAWLRWGKFSNNILFLRYNASVGILNIILLVLINITSWWSTMFSTIIIILSVLFFMYGVLVVITKNWIYHASKAEVAADEAAEAAKSGDERATTLFEKLIFIAFTIVLVLAVVTKSIDNELFTLEPVKRSKDKEISIDKYIHNLDSLATRYYIGCYGGGMKSNAWTMTVLNEMYGRDSTIFHNTVGISGVSGGTIGMVNFFSILNNNPGNDGLTKDKRASLIKEVSTQNILSMDITHATGRDLINYLINPTKASGLDRSTKVMERYAALTGDTFKNEKARSTFRGYWNHLYDSFNESFPILITNTTNVKGNQGMAVSIKTENKNLDSLLYRGSDNILEINRSDLYQNTKEYTLDYYDAASTSNRFPLLSPAAKIETKGHYNDGGIFENSGLFSVYKLFQTVSEKEKVKDLNQLKQKNVFVCIVNDKNLYIKHVLEKRLWEKKDSLLVEEVNYNSELGAILNSVASTEMTPIAIKSQLQRLSNTNDCIEYEPIYLPHKFTVADVKAIFGKKLRLKSGKSADALLYDILHANNDTIDSVYTANKGNLPIVEPPMSRVMAEPAYKFMQLMLEHPVTVTSISKIVGK